jgi:hypothetical protein
LGFELRDYQKPLVEKGRVVLEKFGMLYLAMEVRTGKTFVSLSCCDGLDNVLFITKKKAMSSIEDDYKTGGYKFHLTIINYESLKKVSDDKKWDAIIIDEAHSLGAFPKASGRAIEIKALKSRYPNANTIWLSGTPTPESFSQMFHQFWIDERSPLPYLQKTGFYKYAAMHVNKTQKTIAYGRMVNDYSDTRWEEVSPLIEHLFLYCTQVEAGFESYIDEEILRVKMKDSTYKVIERLKKDLVIGERLIADTPVKLQSKLHQLHSGTIKFEDGTRTHFDNTKAEFIKSHFSGKKIAMFYKFKAEYDCLKEVFGQSLCDNISDFDGDRSKHIALQIQSGREGTKLAEADVLVFYNIDFSATSYWQGRDRMTTMDRKFNKVYWLFSENGIEDKIYRTVVQKKPYTVTHFKKDYKIKFPKKKKV